MIETIFSSGTIITRDGIAYLGWGPQEWRSEPKLGTLNFYFPDFFLSTAMPWLTHQETAVMPIGELLAKLPQGLRESEPLVWSSTDEDLFLNEMGYLRALFAKGSLQKAVPYAFLRSHTPFTQSHLMQSLRHGLETVQHSPGYLYGFWNESDGMLGITPEILFEGAATPKGNSIKTIAVAGTSSVTLPPEALLNDPKTRHEHQLVVQGISESLSKYGRVHVDSCRLLPFRQLTHLATPIELLAATPVSFNELVHQLHPTPALGAYPKKAGMEWLAAYAKKVPRGRYGAPVGVMVTPAEFVCLVAIRNVQWCSKETRIGAGCGVVSQSKDLEEWHEIQSKWKATQQSLGLLTT